MLLHLKKIFYDLHTALIDCEKKILRCSLDLKTNSQFFFTNFHDFSNQKKTNSTVLVDVKIKIYALIGLNYLRKLVNDNFGIRCWIW